MDDLEIIYEELIHIKALSHLSTTVGCLLVEHGQGGGSGKCPVSSGEEYYGMGMVVKECLNSTS